jgi:hypothetical protein
MEFVGQINFLRVCLDGEMISVRIVLFGLVVENSVRLIKYYLDRNLRTVKRIVKIINYFLVFYLIIIFI